MTALSKDTRELLKKFFDPYRLSDTPQGHYFYKYPAYAFPRKPVTVASCLVNGSVPQFGQD